jgi:hypothetical protein
MQIAKSSPKRNSPTFHKRILFSQTLTKERRTTGRDPVRRNRRALEDLETTTRGKTRSLTLNLTILLTSQNTSRTLAPTAPCLALISSTLAIG